MTKRSRGVIFLAFLAAFLLSAPIVVLYTAGYRYNFSSGRIVQTGVLSLNSVPRGANISIDGDALRPTTPSLVKNVLPGEHLVRVEAGAYSAWEKTLVVESRSTTFADDIVLFLDEPPAFVRDAELEAVSISQADAKAAYAQSEGQWTEIWTYDPTTGEDTLVSRLPAGDAGDIDLSWREDGAVLSVESGDARARATTLVDAATGAPIEAAAETDIELTTAADRVVVSRKRDGSSEILAYLPIGDYETRDAPEGIVTLEDVARGRVVLVKAAGGDQPILLNASASEWQWEPNGTRILYSDGFDLHVYDAAAHTDETITRLSSAVTGVAWYPGHSYVLYAQDDAIYAAELDHRDRRNVTRLVSGSGLGTFQSDPRGRVVYFFGTVDGTTGLFSRRLQT